jgi:hypothetical protein
MLESEKSRLSPARAASAPLCRHLASGGGPAAEWRIRRALQGKRLAGDRDWGWSESQKMARRIVGQSTAGLMKQNETF